MQEGSPQKHAKTAKTSAVRRQQTATTAEPTLKPEVKAA
jgi:hypothetical protein